MEVDEERDEINRTFEQLSQSQNSQRPAASQVPTAAVPIPQSNVGNRRKRRDEAAKDGQKLVEPGFDANSAPAPLSKAKKVILDSFRQLLTHKKTSLLSKKNCFNDNPLDNLSLVADYLDLNENGELLKMSSLVYALRVDTTYNDAVAANCQLQPNRMNSVDESTSKKSKTEQKLQQSAATQSLNLQNLQLEMEQDIPEEAEYENGAPAMDPLLDDGLMDDVEMTEEEVKGRDEKNQDDIDLGRVEKEKEKDKDKEDEETDSNDEEDEDMEKGPELSEEQKEKAKDAIPYDSALLTFKNSKDMDIKSIIEAEYERRNRNLDSKADSNPMLMDDEKKFRMEVPPHLTNEYYQIATAHYKDLNASGMLSYNAKVTHNGRVTMMHKRMDTWRDKEAWKHTDPTIPFRRSIAGLVDNAMREHPQSIKNFLFDKEDWPKEENVSTAGQLKEVEEKARERILRINDDFFLNNDEYMIDDEGRPPVTKIVDSDNNIDEINMDGDYEDDEDEEREERDEESGEAGEGTSQAGASSVTSGNRSTPLAETEDDASRITTPKGDKGEQEEESTQFAMSQDEKDDFVAALIHGNQTRKKQLQAAFKGVYTDDEIPNGPVLSIDDLASKFQKDFYDKVGGKKEWQLGANAEELKTDVDTIVAESSAVAKAHECNPGLLGLDHLWTAKYYKRTFTAAEIRAIKQELHTPGKPLDEFKMKAGEYEFVGADDNWTNDDIPLDEFAHTVHEEQVLTRPLGDATELGKYVKTVEKKESDDEDDAAELDDDERITVVQNQKDDSEQNEPMMDDMGDDNGGFDGFSDMDNDDLPTSSTTGDKPVDFTAGDDQRLGEDVNGMQDPLFVSEIQPSDTVRATGKTDDSHWKGGKPEVQKVKKEKKKKPKNDPIAKANLLFDTSLGAKMLESSYKKIPQAESNRDLIKETECLLMPSMVNVVPQMEYDPRNFTRPFLLPEAIFSKYVYQSQEDEDEEAAAARMKARLGHYTHVLELNEADDGEDNDVFVSFLRTFKSYPDVATRKEIEVEQRVTAGELEPEEAAAEMNGHDDGMHFGMDDGDDFGGDGGAGDGDEGESRGRRSHSKTPAEVTFRHKSIERALSQPRTETADDEGSSSAVIDDEQETIYHIGAIDVACRMIKLDTVAMKTGILDVLTNDQMDARKVQHTLSHFVSALPPSQPDEMKEKKRKEKKAMQTIDEDAELEVDEYNTTADTSLGEEEQAAFDRTCQDIPDALNVSRALFAPKKEKISLAKPMTFGDAAGTSQTQANSSTDHIEIAGRHTLKSTFTCLPARMPDKAVSDVTVASTLSMILHLANENSLALVQDKQMHAVLDAEGNPIATDFEFMGDFEMKCENDPDGTMVHDLSQSIVEFNEVLQTLSADEDPSDAEKRQKMLEEIASNQKKERESTVNAIKRKEVPTTSTSSTSDAVVLGDTTDSSDDDSDVEVVEDVKKKPAFKQPAVPKKAAVRRNGDDEDEAGPSTKRARPSRPSNGTTSHNTTDEDDSIVIVD